MRGRCRGDYITGKKGRYEFVKPEEYSPVRKELESILRNAKSYLEKNSDLTFHYQMVGSGQRGLITRVISGNKGFDFDYNLELPDLDYGWSYKPKEVKQQFMKAFEHAVRGTKWRPPQDSTSVMTLRVVDTKNSRIEYGCDLAIVFYSDDGMMNYLYSHKNGGYSFYSRKRSNISMIRSMKFWIIMVRKMVGVRSRICISVSRIPTGIQIRGHLCCISRLSTMFMTSILRINIGKSAMTISIMMMTIDHFIGIEIGVNYEQRSLRTYTFATTVE